MYLVQIELLSRANAVDHWIFSTSIFSHFKYIQKLFIHVCKLFTNLLPFISGWISHSANVQMLAD